MVTSLLVPSNRVRGFSLVELMVGVVIVGIMLSMASLGFDIVRNFRMSDVAGDLQTSFVLARSEAIKRNEQVTVEPDANGWSRGWKVKTSSAQVLQESTTPNDLTITGVSGPIVFRPTGRPAVAVPIMELSMPETTGRCVSLGSDGRVRVTKGAC